MPTSEFASVFILVFTFSMFVVILINRHLFHAFVFETYWSVWQKQKANLLVYHLIWGFSSHSLHLKHKSAILDIKYLLTIVTIIITIDLWICICTLTLFYFSSSVFTVIRELYHILPSEDFRFELRFKFQISLLQCHNTLQFHIASNLNRFNWEETADSPRGKCWKLELHLISEVLLDCKLIFLHHPSSAAWVLWNSKGIYFAHVIVVLSFLLTESF